MTRSDPPNPTTDFFQQRLGCLTSVVEASRAVCADYAELADCEDLTVDELRGYAAQVVKAQEVSLKPLGTERQLLAFSVSTWEEDTQFLVVSVQAGCATTVQRLAQATLESWELTQQVEASNHALEESAMQLAQSFEERNWLRSFARSASSFSSDMSANKIADGILKPLGYLLRAQDVFLMVEESELLRSGLTSAKYGDSEFTIPSVLQAIRSLGASVHSPPLVRNHINIDTPEGRIHSVIAVPVIASQPLGFLVGINRSTELHIDGLPVYDPEFGSVEVGVLEEAGVLLASQAENVRHILESNQLFLGTLYAMSSAIDARDKYTQGHSQRVARLGFELAKILGLSEEASHEIYLSGILHDVGKIGIPDSVLLKDGPLTNEEYLVIQRHPEIGYRIVEQLGQLHFALPGILYHHERWDGKGYPHGLAGHSIPLMGRVLAVADAFDAMTSSRPYRHAMPLQKAISIITAGAGTQWDSEIVKCFSSWLKSCNIADSQTSAHGLIPLDTPSDYLIQAVSTLGQ